MNNKFEINKEYDGYIDSIAFFYRQNDVIVLPSSTQIKKDFKFLPWDYMDEITMSRYGCTLCEALDSVEVAYILFRENIEIKNEDYQYDITRVVEKEALGEILDYLEERYRDEKAVSYKQIIDENYGTSSLAHYCKHIYNYQCKAILKNLGIIETEQEGLERITKALKERYFKHPAVSLGQVTEDNKDLHINILNEYSKKIMNMTAKEYLIDIGVIIGNPRVSKKDIYRSLERDILYLKIKYNKKKAFSLEQIKEENQDINLNALNEYAKKKFNKTGAEYLTGLGIIESEKVESCICNVRVNTEVDEFNYDIGILKERYSKNPAKSFLQVIKENRAINFDNLDCYTNKYYSNDIEEYLKKIKVILDINSLTGDEYIEAKLHEGTDILLNKYADIKATSLEEIKNEFPANKLRSMELWIERLYSISLDEYLKDKGILAEEHMDGDAESVYKNIILVLKSRYTNKIANSLFEIYRDNKDFPLISRLEEVITELFSEYPQDVLIREGVLKETSRPIKKK